jgi:hypothetical protein
MSTIREDAEHYPINKGDKPDVYDRIYERLTVDAACPPKIAHFIISSMTDMMKCTPTEEQVYIAYTGWQLRMPLDLAKKLYDAGLLGEIIIWACNEVGREYSAVTLGEPTPKTEPDEDRDEFAAAIDSWNIH